MADPLGLCTGSTLTYWTIRDDHVCWDGYDPRDDDNPLGVPFRTRDCAQLSAVAFIEEQIAAGNAGRVAWRRLFGGLLPDGFRWCPGKHDVEQRIIRAWAEREAKTGEPVSCATWEWRVVKVCRKRVSGVIDGIEVTGTQEVSEPVSEWAPYSSDGEDEPFVCRGVIDTLRHDLEWGDHPDSPWGQRLALLDYRAPFQREAV